MTIPAYILAILLPLFPVCQSEDSTACAWNASTQGNGRGESFIALSETLIIKES